MSNLQPVRYPAVKGGQMKTQQKPGRGRPGKSVKMNQGQKEAKRAMASRALPKVPRSRKNNPKQK